MAMRILTFSVLACALGMLSGCFAGPSSDTRFYVLDYTPTVSTERVGKSPWPSTVLVRNFAMGEAYLRSELVYRTSTHEIRYHADDRWAVRPEHVVSDMVGKHLSQVQLFSAVQNQYNEYRPGYELRGRVNSLEEYNTPSGRFAHLGLNLDFVRLADNRVLWSCNMDTRHEVSGEGRVLIVQALSGLLQTDMDVTIRAIDSVMREEPPLP
ncbi:MAG: ABC-type transport auxiliary lipoprotein component [Fibrobacterota bacterium]|jgi:ABC-type uncharacterized transport system auxiliary subunit